MSSRDSALAGEYRRVLQAVAEHGVKHSPLPPRFETVRQKYQMTGPEYDTYWQIAAGSQLKGEALFTHAAAKARRRLKEARIKEKRYPATSSAGPSHRQLMSEAWGTVRSAGLEGGEDKGKQAVENTTEAHDASLGPEAKLQASGRDDHESLADIKANQSNGLSLRDIDKTLPHANRQISRSEDLSPRSPKSRLNQSSTTSNEAASINSQRTPIGRKQWRERQRMLAVQEKATKDILERQRKEIEELKAMLPNHQQQLTISNASQLEIQDKAEDLKKRKAVLLQKKAQLLQQLEAEGNANSPARYTRNQKPQTWKSKVESFNLDDILDVAIEKTTTTVIAPAEPYKKVAKLSSSAVSEPRASPTVAPKAINASENNSPSPSDSAIADVAVENNTHTPLRGLRDEIALRTVQRRPSDSLRLNVPASGEIEIDSDLVIDLNAETPQLQANISQMQQHLKSSYPRIDTLPYDIWASENRKTLQTWLKILITRWKGRFDDVAEPMDGSIDPQVRAVLDHMVRDHDLSNESAKRMAKKWNEVFRHRGDMSGDAEGVIDWDEFDAGGMGFLKAEEQDTDDAMESNEVSPAETVPLLPPRNQTTASYASLTRRLYSTSSRPPLSPTPAPKESLSSQPSSPQTPSQPQPSLPHLTASGSAHMVSVSAKPHTVRTAIAVGTVYFSNPTPLALIKSNALKKGDVLSVARIAGIMAAKKCPDLIPLCHPIPLTHVGVELAVFSPSNTRSDADAVQPVHTNDLGHGGVTIEAKVSCTGPTGVEMEALTSVMGAALSVVDMCKAVDRFQRVQDVRVVQKEGGKSGVWREEGWRSWGE